MFDVVTIGTATRDVYLKSGGFKVIKNKKFLTGLGQCLDLGFKNEVSDIFFTTGGGATNAAVTFARQGLKTAIATMVGDDPGGQAAIAELEKEKVSADFIKKMKNFVTAYSVLLLMPAGERSILVYRGAAEHLELKDIPFDKIKTKWIYLAPLGGNLAKLFEPILTFAAKNKIKVAVNPSAAQIKMGIKKLGPLLKKVDIFILNREEASLLTGFPYAKEKEIFKKLDEHVPGLAVMTEGPKGVWVSDGKNLWKAGIYPEKKITDRTGAGDAFGSGFTVGYILTRDVEYAIKLGSANATSKVEHLGAKGGLLYKEDFNSPRWKKLQIQKKLL